MVEGSCRRCGGELRQAAILANYKSFVISLMRCASCGATFERKENAHRPAEKAEPRRERAREQADQPPSEPKPASDGRRQLVPDPIAPPAQPAEKPRRRLKPANRIDRPFNVRVTRRGDR